MQLKFQDLEYIPMSQPDDPVPAYFTWRYLLWLCWTNAITLLATLQGLFSILLLEAGEDPSFLTHTQIRWIYFANAALLFIVAQAKKQNPPGPPPMKAPLTQQPESK